MLQAFQTYIFAGLHADSFENFKTVEKATDLFNDHPD